MRLPFLGLLVLLGAGCARVWMPRVDYTQNTFMLCGNRWAGASDFSERAAATCPAPALLRCGMEDVGTAVTTVVSASTAVTRTKASCCEYRCG